MEVIVMKPQQQLLIKVSGEDVGGGGGSIEEPRSPEWDALLGE